MVGDFASYQTGAKQKLESAGILPNQLSTSQQLGNRDKRFAGSANAKLCRHDHVLSDAG
jgi:hypothetical protein